MIKQLICGVLALTLSSLSLRAESIVLVAGSPTGTDADGGPAVSTKLMVPFAVGIDKDGNLYLPEFTAERIRKIDSKGIVSTFAGMGPGHKSFSGDGGPATKAEINFVHNLIVGHDGMIYVADTGNYRVRKIDPATGIISTFAGTGAKGFSGDGGPASKAQIGGIFSIALDPKGERMYLCDLDNKRIEVVDMKTGVIKNFAGTGTRGVPKDGADASSSPLFDPRAVAADSHGNVYILERAGNALRVVDAHGKIRTVAGTGKKGYSGDGGDALQATFSDPKHICVDLEDNVIIADAECHTVRKYSPKDGKVTLIAGTGKSGTSGLNGPPEKAQLNRPHGVFVDASGTLYIADSYNNRVLKIVK